MLRKLIPALIFAVAATVAHADKVSGFVKGKPSGSTFVVANGKGTYTVDASKAKVTMKGKSFMVGSLTGGSQVNVVGTIKGKNVMATSVEVGFLRAPGKIVAKAPKKAAAAKATTKTMTKPKPSTEAKPKAASTAKPKSSSKMSKPAKMDSKAKTDAKPKASTKSKSKSKAKPKMDDKKPTTGGN